MACAIFIPIFYLHHVYTLLQKNHEYQLRIILSYLFGIVGAISCYSPLFIKGMSPKLGFVFWPDAGVLFAPFLIFWFLFVILGIHAILKALLSAVGTFKEQLWYLLIATIVGWSGGGTNYPLWFNIPLPPVGNILISVYVVLVAYAIVRYRLMDIRVAFTRAGIFFTVYTVVLGIPIWLGFKMLGSGAWIWPVTLMGILATIGPSIFIFFQRRAEERLLAEQKRYQNVLRQASAGMGHIRELDRLYKLIAHILTRTVLMESAVIYALNEEKHVYTRVAYRYRKAVKNDFMEFNEDSLLVEELIKSNGRIFIDEVRFRATESKSTKDCEIGALLNQMEASLVFGIFIENKLDTLVVMGPKAAGQPYTEDDLSVFSILTNQAALAIENARFYENVRKTQEQLFRAEKMATIGTMADGVSHQINNRFHAMGFIAGDILDTLNMYEKHPERFKIEDVLGEIRTGLKRVEENVGQGSQVVRGLLDYSRNDTKTEKEGVDIHKLLKASLDMVSLKVHLQDFDRHIDIPPDVPRVVGNFVQLQEVFFNIIDNAHFSMMDKKAKKLEADYKPCMVFSSEVVGDRLRLMVKDNGLGIKDEDQKKLFTPFFTTKVSSRKGNGLGLYVMRKIIEEDHGGTIKFASEYPKGVIIEIMLPVI
jgi:two-component system nitrogen regulation sensor histidine kinase GlnL